MGEHPENPSRIDCILVAGGQFHDIDYARLELLKLFGEDQRIRARVFNDYDFGNALDIAKTLVTYTCNVVPDEPMQRRLQAWLEAGGRWLALHGTNALLELMDDGIWRAPRTIPLLAELLGSQFLSHPPIAPYTVRATDPSHPLVAGIEPFETDDELYHMELHGPLQVLLETDCGVAGDSFEEGDKAPGIHPVFYLKKHGKGGVLYLTLGHCRGHYDLQPMADWWPSVDRGSWNLPEYRTLLQRGIAWARGGAE